MDFHSKQYFSKNLFELLWLVTRFGFTPTNKLRVKIVLSAFDHRLPWSKTWPTPPNDLQLAVTDAVSPCSRPRTTQSVYRGHRSRRRLPRLTFPTQSGSIRNISQKARKLSPRSMRGTHCARLLSYLIALSSQRDARVLLPSLARRNGIPASPDDRTMRSHNRAAR